MVREHRFQLALGGHIVVDDELDVGQVGLGVIGAEATDAIGYLADRFVDRLLHDAEHNAHPNCRQGHRGVASIRGGLETVVDDVAQATFQIVDHKDHVLEGAVVFDVAGCDDGLAVTQGHCILRLLVKLITSIALNDTVDAAEPHTARVDGGDEGVGGDSGDVARSNLNTNHFSNLTFVDREQVESCLYIL